MEKAKIRLVGNVSLYELPKDFIYNDFKGLTEKEKTSYLINKGDNLVVNTGLYQILDLMLGIDTSSFNYCRVGSGSTTPVATNTDLETIIGSGVLVSDRYKTGEIGYFNTFFSASSNNGTWNETGLANASTGGDLLCRRVFSVPFVKNTSNSAIVSWVITLASVAD